MRREHTHASSLGIRMVKSEVSVDMFALSCCLASLSLSIIATLTGGRQRDSCCAIQRVVSTKDLETWCSGTCSFSKDCHKCLWNQESLWKAIHHLRACSGHACLHWQRRSEGSHLKEAQSSEQPWHPYDSSGGAGNDKLPLFYLYIEIEYGSIFSGK